MQIKFEAKPNLLGKFTTTFQMILLILILLQWKISIPVAYVTGVLTILSGIVYITKGLKVVQ